MGFVSWSLLPLPLLQQAEWWLPSPKPVCHWKSGQNKSKRQRLLPPTLCTSSWTSLGLLQPPLSWYLLTLSLHWFQFLLSWQSTGLWSLREKLAGGLAFLLEGHLYLRQPIMVVTADIYKSTATIFSWNFEGICQNSDSPPLKSEVQSCLGQSPSPKCT